MNLQKRQWVNARRKDALERTERARLPSEWVRHDDAVQREQEFMQQLVYPHSRVVCIGAMGDPTLDPSPLFFATKVKRKNVYLVDCIQGSIRSGKPLLSRRLDAERQKQEKKGKLSSYLEKRLSLLSNRTEHTGEGGLDRYWRFAFPLLNKKLITLVPALAWDTGIRKNSVHIVVDRGSWQYIGKHDENSLQRTFEHYLSLLKNGGRIVYTMSNMGGLPPWRLTEMLEEQVKIGRIRVDHVFFSNEKPYDVPETYAGWRHSAGFVVTKLAQKPILG